MQSPRRRALGLCALAAFWLGQLSVPGAGNTSFRPGELWLDTDGMPIQAHGGGLTYENGTYYWIGEYKPDAALTRSGVHFYGIRCYSSKDLYNWKNLGMVLNAVTNDPASDLHFSRVCEGPQVLRNPKTGKYVLWFHTDETPDYTIAKAGVAISDKITGPYRYLGSMHPDGEYSRDMTLFKDDDGTGYLIFDASHSYIHFSRLTDDYLDTSGKYANAFQASGPALARESPVVFKFGGKYWIITSGMTGWDANAAQYAYASSIFGPWTVVGNPCVGAGADTTFHSQGSHVEAIAGIPNGLIFMSDRWTPANPAASRYLWLPIKIVGNSMTIRWYNPWTLSLYATAY